MWKPMATPIEVNLKLQKCENKELFTKKTQRVNRLFNVFGIRVKARYLFCYQLL